MTFAQLQAKIDKLTASADALAVELGELDAFEDATIEAIRSLAKQARAAMKKLQTLSEQATARSDSAADVASALDGFVGSLEAVADDLESYEA